MIHGRFLLFNPYSAHTENCSLSPGWGVDVDIRDTIGWTPLVICARHDYIEILELLIARGASVYVEDDEGRDALSAAIEFGQELCVKSLA